MTITIDGKAFLLTFKNIRTQDLASLKKTSTIISQYFSHCAICFQAYPRLPKIVYEYHNRISDTN